MSKQFSKRGVADYPQVELEVLEVVKEVAIVVVVIFVVVFIKWIGVFVSMR